MTINRRRLERHLGQRKFIPKGQRMKVAVEGCCHGELDAIYRHIESLEQKNQYKVDLLLICGDFQAIRNHQDLQCMAVPAKYRQLGEFYKYYTGEKKASLLTIVIGGNHEASNYMWELYHGGWLAPNIYFLGHAGCLQVNGVRIAGASGIFKGNDFRLGNWERLPYDNSSMRSIYHIREFNVRRLSLLSSPDIFLSHDWPQSIEQYGDVRSLLRRKPFFRRDMETGQLGSPPLMGLLRTLRPQWWFAAHLHVRFEATVIHEDGPDPGTSSASGQNPDEILIEEDLDSGLDSTAASASLEPKNTDEIILDDELETVEIPNPPVVPSTTNFLALDKCLPRREFLEVVDIPTPTDRQQEHGAIDFKFDPEWLAITRAFHRYLSPTRHQPPFPDEEEARDLVRKESLWVQEHLSREDAVSLEVEEYQKFVQTAPGPGLEGKAINTQPPWYTNPQTVAFCNMLDLENKINPPPTGA